MNKEEFPTFLNEQPTVIFGRTARELLIIVCGILESYATWAFCRGLWSNQVWGVASYILAAVPLLLAFVVALVPVANRPLEQWFFIWLFYLAIPKIYIFKPGEDQEIGNNEEELPFSSKEEALLESGLEVESVF